jgi:BioD-like phosphotransacetylase family protein
MSIVLVSSPEANAGKTAAIVAIGQRLRRQGLRVDYRRTNGPEAAADAAFVSTVLRLTDGASATPVEAGLFVRDSAPSSASSDVTFVELDDLAALNSGVIAALNQAGARSLIVARYHADGLVDTIVEQARLVSLATVVIINAVPEKGRRQVEQRVAPALTAAGLVVAGIVPQDRSLLGLSVGDLARQLGAEVLCAEDALDEPVEAVMISAMSDEGAEHYFRRISRKAVVAGGDRPDIHMPALATDTSCIVLTEGHDPDPTVFKTADEQSIPLLKVKPSTMETLDHVSAALANGRFRQTYKVARSVALFGSNLDESRLYRALDIAGREVAT